MPVGRAITEAQLNQIKAAARRAIRLLTLMNSYRRQVDAEIYRIPETVVHAYQLREGMNAQRAVFTREITRLGNLIRTLGQQYRATRAALRRR